MLCNDSRRFRCSVGATVGKLAVILVVLTVASWALAAPKNDKNEDANYLPGEQTRVYQHTYDEVFQAAQEAIEREGLFVSDNDKDKGTISGKCYGGLIVFTLHIESLNTKPETRVTLNTHFTKKVSRRSINPVFNVPITMQKVLATYR